MASRDLAMGAMLGNMPSHLVADDVARGRLKVIRPIEFDPLTAQLAMGGIYPANRQLGPDGRWMLDHLASCARA